VCDAIKGLTMSRSQKTKLLTLATPIRLALAGVKGEIEEKLGIRRRMFEHGILVAWKIVPTAWGAKLHDGAESSDLGPVCQCKV
jgi:hypothetical protein